MSLPGTLLPSRQRSVADDDPQAVRKIDIGPSVTCISPPLYLLLMRRMLLKSQRPDRRSSGMKAPQVELD